MAYNPYTGMDDPNYTGDGSTDAYSTQTTTGGTPQPQTYLTPGYQEPAPGPNASAPRAGVNPSVIFTDLQGNGYDLPALQAKLASDPTFKNDPANARAQDIINSYTNPPPPNAPAPTSSGGGAANPDYAALFAASPSPLANANTGRSNDLYSTLSSLFSTGGGFNKDLVNQENQNVRDTLNLNRKSQLANDQAYLADRGLMGGGTPGTASGPEATALNYLDTNLNQQYNNAVTQNYANEENNANNRMLEALQLATGMNANDAANLINSYEAQTSRALGLGNFTLGEGNLALGNVNAANNYNLGVANLGLNRDIAQQQLSDSQVSQLIQLLTQLYGGAQTSSAGYF